MALGNKKGHIAGKKVTGGHTTVIDGVDKILKKIATKPWFVSIRPGMIEVDRGGSQFVSIKRHKEQLHQNTLTLTFRKSSTLQKVDVRGDALEENMKDIVSDIEAIIRKEWPGADVYNRTGAR